VKESKAGLFTRRKKNLLPKRCSSFLFCRTTVGSIIMLVSGSFYCNPSGITALASATAKFYSFPTDRIKID
jgi:hypothetical protein